MFGKSTNPQDYQQVARPVAAMAKDFAAGFRVARHHHERAQLVFATRGVMQVTAAGGIWVVPPHRGLWIPGAVEHEIQCTGGVAMRTLYIRPDAAKGLPASVCVLAVQPLLRELILEAVKLPLDYAERDRDGRIMALILDELRALPILPLHLPMPHDPRLVFICDAIMAAPALRRPLAAWGGKVGASSRTLARLFLRETGMSFGAWCRQARLLNALARLAEGQKVTSIALDLGYDSPSAFTSMFRRHLAITPSRYFLQSDGARPGDGSV
jgi:AraC-like DNA-binding protein/mannose-6-phosphate isomerase-like protein (cupin superfamily)